LKRLKKLYIDRIKVPASLSNKVIINERYTKTQFMNLIS